MSDAANFISSFVKFRTQNEFTKFVDALEGAQNLFSEFESILKTKQSLQWWKIAGNVQYTENTSLYSKIVAALSVDWSETNKSKKERASAARSLVESLALKDILETFSLEEINNLCDVLETKNIDWIAGVEQLKRPAEELRQIAVVLAELEKQTFEIAKTIQKHAYKVREDLISQVKQITDLLSKILFDTQRALESDLLKCGGDLKRFHQKKTGAIKIADQQLLEAVQVIKQAKQTFEAEQLKLGLAREAYVNYEPYQNLLKLAKEIQRTHREVNLFLYPEQTLSLLLKLLRTGTEQDWMSSDIYKMIAFIQQLFPDDAKKLAGLFDILHDIPSDFIVFDKLASEIKQLNEELGLQEGEAPDASVILLHSVESLIEKRRAFENSAEKPPELIAELRSYQADMQSRVIILLKLQCRQIVKLRQMQNYILSSMKEVEAEHSFVVLLSLSSGLTNLDTLPYTELEILRKAGGRFCQQITEIEIKAEIYRAASEGNLFAQALSKENNARIRMNLAALRRVIPQDWDESDLCLRFISEKEQRDQVMQAAEAGIENFKALPEILKRRQQAFEGLSVEMDAEKKKLTQIIVQYLQPQLSQPDKEITEESLLSLVHPVMDDCVAIHAVLEEKLQESAAESSQDIQLFLEKPSLDFKLYWDGNEDSVGAALVNLSKGCMEDRALYEQLVQALDLFKNLVYSTVHEAFLKHQELLLMEAELEAIAQLSSKMEADSVQDSIAELEERLAKLKALSSEK